MRIEDQTSFVVLAGDEWELHMPTALGRANGDRAILFSKPGPALSGHETLHIDPCEPLYSCLLELVRSIGRRWPAVLCGNCEGEGCEECDGCGLNDAVKW